MNTSVSVEELKPLTALRFIAAMMIVALHSALYFSWGLPARSSPVPLTHGVSFFFVLSGFILTHVYGTRRVTYGGFLWARFARLWPVHLVTCLAVLMVIRPDSQQFPGTGWFSPWLALAANLSLVHAAVPFGLYVFSWNSVSWSISTEFFFYLAFPVLLTNIERTWLLKLCASAWLILLYAVLVRWAEIPPTDTVDELGVTFLLYSSPLFRGFEFVLGMSAYQLWRRIRGLEIGLAAGSGIEVAALAMAVAWYASLAPALLPFFARDIVASHWFATAGGCFVFAGIIIAFASGRGVLGRLLSLRPLVWLGEISFALYMAHQVFMKWLYLGTLEGRWGAASMPVAIGGCILAAAILHHAVELPARRFLLHARARRPATTHPLPALPDRVF